MSIVCHLHLSWLRAGIFEWRPIWWAAHALRSRWLLVSPHTCCWFPVWVTRHERKTVKLQTGQNSDSFSGQTDKKADRQKTDMRSVPLCWQTNVQKELSSWMASSFKVTAGVSHSLLIYLSVMVTRSLQQTQALSWKTRGDLFFHILQWAPSMPGIGIWKAAHCLKQSLITPLKWKPLTLDFNLIIIVSFHEQGNYSTETSNSGFLSKYLQWLMRLVWFPVLPVRQSLKRLVFMRTNWTSICYNEKFWQNKK